MVAHSRNPDSKPCISTDEERQNAPLISTTYSTTIILCIYIFALIFFCFDDSGVGEGVIVLGSIFTARLCASNFRITVLIDGVELDRI